MKSVNRSSYVLSLLVVLISVGSCESPRSIPICCTEKPVALHQTFREVEQLFPGKLIIEKNYWGRPTEGHTYSFNEKKKIGTVQMENLYALNFKKGRLCYYSKTTYFQDGDGFEIHNLSGSLQHEFQQAYITTGRAPKLSFVSDSVVANFRAPGYEEAQEFYIEIETYLPNCEPIDR